MAQQTTVACVEPRQRPRRRGDLPFALDGVSYEIDLTAAHAATLRDDLPMWVSYARRTGGRPATPSTRTGRTAADREQTTAVRAWARSNGYTVSDRGRIRLIADGGVGRLRRRPLTHLVRFGRVRPRPSFLGGVGA